MNVKHKKCEGCQLTRPHFGLPAEGKVRWCAGCAKAHAGAVDVGNKMCEGCGLKRSNFGLLADGKKKRWCSGCAKAHAGVVDVVSKKCEDCQLKQPTYGVLATGKKKRWSCTMFSLLHHHLLLRHHLLPRHAHGQLRTLLRGQQSTAAIGARPCPGAPHRARRGRDEELMPPHVVATQHHPGLAWGGRWQCCQQPSSPGLEIAVGRCPGGGCSPGRRRPRRR